MDENNPVWIDMPESKNAVFIKEYNLEERKSGEIYDQLEKLAELEDKFGKVVNNSNNKSTFSF